MAHLIDYTHLHYIEDALMGGEISYGTIYSYPYCDKCGAWNPKRLTSDGPDLLMWILAPFALLAFVIWVLWIPILIIFALSEGLRDKKVDVFQCTQCGYRYEIREEDRFSMGNNPLSRMPEDAYNAGAKWVFKDDHL